MSIFDLDTSGAEALDQEARANGAPYDPDPGFFHNVGTSVGMGIMKGGAKTVQALGIAASAPLAMLERDQSTDRVLSGYAPGELTDAYYRQLDEFVTSAVDYWTPAPEDTGTAGRILGGFSEIALPLLAGGGNPTLLVGTTELAGATELAREGVAPETAIGVGALEGASSAAGFRIPFLGKTLATRMFSGAGGNLALNRTSLALEQAALQAGGEDDLAKNFDPFSAEGAGVDVLSGFLFGGLAHAAHGRMQAQKLPREVLNALLTLDNAHHFQEGTAPGISADLESSGAHQEALEQAINAVLSGEPVVAPPAVLDATFHPIGRETALPEGEPHQALTQGAEETTAQLAKRVEERFDAALKADPEGMTQRYEAIPDTQGGRVLSVDTARELSPDYEADRSRSAWVHEPASDFIKKLYAEKLKEAPAEGQKPLVVFTAGGTGAGKTSGIKRVPEMQAVSDQAQIIYDTNMQNVPSAIKKIDQAIAADKDVTIIYVARDPIAAMAVKGGALGRAMKIGRTVPLKTHAETHVGAAQAILKLAEHYKGNPHVAIRVIQNERGNVRLSSLDSVQQYEYHDLVGKLYETLQQAKDSGQISEKVYQGFLNGDDPALLAAGDRAPEALGPDRGASRRAPEKPAARVTPDPTPAEKIALEEAESPTHAVYTAAGRMILVTPKLVEADSILTSDRPEYPQSLQPRQRADRAASAEQVRDIAQNLRPELLGNAPEADRGAPIVGPNGAVESGNGRVMALREVYAKHPDKAQEYRQFLEKQGYDLAGFKEPVLIRVRETELNQNELRAFTVESNQSATMAMSAVERAQADAQLLDAGALELIRNGDLSSAGNVPFTRTFLARLPVSERNALMGPDGVLSQEGLRRIEAAVLAKAYGGTAESNRTLHRMLEANDADLKSVSGALLDTAGPFAQLRQSIEDGVVARDFDIAPKIVKAVEEIASLRARGQSVHDFLQQGDLLAVRDPTVDALVRAMYTKDLGRLAGREKIEASLARYAREAKKQRLDQGSLFGMRSLTPGEILNEAPAQEAKNPISPDMFGLRTPQGKAKVPTEPDTLVSAAQAKLAEGDLQIPTGEFDSTGEPIRASAQSLLDQATADVARAEEQGKAFKAAVECYMGEAA